jgi:hypothetical protein
VTLLPYMLAMSLVGSVPPHVSAVTWAAAHRHGQDPATLGAYLISEHGHDWTPTPDQCGDSGRTCGPFSLSGTWPKAFGYRHADRANAAKAADMAAQLLQYSRESHEDCTWDHCDAAGAYLGHHWQAHVKSGPGGRHLAAWSVARWLDFEGQLRASMGEL